MNKIGLTLLLVWLAVRLLLPIIPMIVMSRTVEMQVMNILPRCAVWILLTSRMYKTRRSWFGFMAAV